MYQLLIRGIKIAPAQVFFYGAAKEGILLEYHSNIVSQCLQGIVPDIYTAYLYTAASHIVQTGDELH